MSQQELENKAKLGAMLGKMLSVHAEFDNRYKIYSDAILIPGADLVALSIEAERGLRSIISELPISECPQMWPELASIAFMLMFRIRQRLAQNQPEVLLDADLEAINITVTEIVTAAAKVSPSWNTNHAILELIKQWGELGGAPRTVIVRVCLMS